MAICFPLGGNNFITRSSLGIHLHTLVVSFLNAVVNAGRLLFGSRIIVVEFASKYVTSRSVSPGTAVHVAIGAPPLPTIGVSCAALFPDLKLCVTLPSHCCTPPVSVLYEVCDLTMFDVVGPASARGRHYVQQA